jgi:predicted esterase
LIPVSAAASSQTIHLPAGPARATPIQDTGFLNRQLVYAGVVHRYQVYVPEEWRRNDNRKWPIILFLHGRGERGSEGMWQTQVGLPEAVRDHPERWPFIIVMPQCPLGSFWTDNDHLAMAMEALDQETQEFHGDPDRTYLSGISMGGYGAWELARDYPHRWAAIAIASGGIFWSYEPQRWLRAATLPTEYARAVGHTPIWLFHGTDDPVVAPRQDELLYEAFKSTGGHIRLWLYQGLKHDTWTRAYREPELPRWLLEHRLPSTPQEPPSFAERLLIPLHPPAVKLTTAQIENLVGEYFDSNGLVALTITWQNDRLYAKDRVGQVSDLAAASPTELFYPEGSSLTHLVAERDTEGRITAIVLHDDRHEERWDKRRSTARR